MRKVGLLPTRDCEAGYAPATLHPNLFQLTVLRAHSPLIMIKMCKHRNIFA